MSSANGVPARRMTTAQAVVATLAVNEVDTVFCLGEYDPIGQIAGAGLSADDVAAICGENARRCWDYSKKESYLAEDSPQRHRDTENNRREKKKPDFLTSPLSCFSVSLCLCGESSACLLSCLLALTPPLPKLRPHRGAFRRRRTLDLGRVPASQMPDPWGFLRMPRNRG